MEDGNESKPNVDWDDNMASSLGGGDGGLPQGGSTRVVAEAAARAGPGNANSGATISGA